MVLLSLFMLMTTAVLADTLEIAPLAGASSNGDNLYGWDRNFGNDEFFGAQSITFDQNVELIGGQFYSEPLQYFPSAHADTEITVRQVLDGPILATALLPYDTTPGYGDEGWKLFTFDAPAVLESGVTYYIQFKYLNLPDAEGVGAGVFYQADSTYYDGGEVFGYTPCSYGGAVCDEWTEIHLRGTDPYIGTSSDLVMSLEYEPIVEETSGGSAGSNLAYLSNIQKLQQAQQKEAELNPLEQLIANIRNFLLGLFGHGGN